MPIPTIWATRYHIGAHCRVVVFDNPGFDDTRVSDSEALCRIVVWLGASFAGVVYVYPAYPGRVTTNDCSNVQVFGKIRCGDAGLSKVILATTRWNLCAEAVGESREKELVETFSTNLLRNPQGAEGKAKTMRLHNTTDSARKIIQAILEKMAQSKINGVILGLQDQLVIRNKRFQQTEAAKELKIKLVELQKDTESRIIK